MTDSHWCPRHPGVWVVPSEPCHLCVAETEVRKPHVVQTFRMSSRYLALGFTLSYVSEDDDGPSGITFRVSLLIFHYDLYVEWG